MAGTLASGGYFGAQAARAPVGKGVTLMKSPDPYTYTSQLTITCDKRRGALLVTVATNPLGPGVLLTRLGNNSEAARAGLPRKPPAPSPIQLAAALTPGLLQACGWVT